MLAFWRRFDCDNHVTTEQVTKGNESLSKGRHLVRLFVRSFVTQFINNRGEYFYKHGNRGHM